MKYKIYEILNNSIIIEYFEEKECKDCFVSFVNIIPILKEFNNLVNNYA
jgi:hypothetical protein